MLLGPPEPCCPRCPRAPVFRGVTWCSLFPSIPQGPVFLDAAAGCTPQQRGRHRVPLVPAASPCALLLAAPCCLVSPGANPAALVPFAFSSALVLVGRDVQIPELQCLLCAEVPRPPCLYCRLLSVAVRFLVSPGVPYCLVSLVPGIPRCQRRPPLAVVSRIPPGVPCPPVHPASPRGRCQCVGTASPVKPRAGGGGQWGSGGGAAGRCLRRRPVPRRREPRSGRAAPAPQPGSEPPARPGPPRRAPPPSMRFFRLTFKCFVDCF